ncbi:hypothetical protein EDD18DRAFT_1109487 [Armillaria luteobubalina]|uniref:Protein kinase domain-containing protein n=1 Tax=Armillaria luteobubalina TaxID=153913 RepID=A0AA39PW95_9AGAR|nr:hypothetical protein EDD18DRAFT_1109487 [Armillaria luteobubalina]
MSSVSTRVKQPILQHETRIPDLSKATGRFPLEHFEYIAMEILGPNIAEQKNTIGTWIGRCRLPSMELVDKVLAGLEHTHSNGILHGVIEPGRISCGLNGFTIKTIDFGLSNLDSQDTIAKHQHSSPSVSSAVTFLKTPSTPSVPAALTRVHPARLQPFALFQSASRVAIVQTLIHGFA